VILDSAPLLSTSPAVWDPESGCAARLSVRDPAVRIRRIISPDRPWNIGWVSRRVAHEAGILTSSPHVVIDHPSRSPHLRRPATVLGQYKYEIEVNRRLRRGHSLVWNNAISPPSGPAIHLDHVIAFAPPIALDIRNRQVAAQEWARTPELGMQRAKAVQRTLRHLLVVDVKVWRIRQSCGSFSGGFSPPQPAKKAALYDSDRICRKTGTI
jgi:hypothetical protein